MHFLRVVVILTLYLNPAIAVTTDNRTPGQDTEAADAQVAAFACLDGLVAEVVRRWSIPGAGIAVAKGGQMVHWQGFGYADRDRGVPVERPTLFRIASVSKPITAVAVLRLVEAGKLSLETTLADVLPDLLRDLFDANIPKVTVRQLLQHSAGWDDGDHDETALRDDVRRLARTADPQGVMSPLDVVVRRFQRPLDFVPGTDHAYSNFGYLVLGRIVEKVSGKPYSGFIEETLSSRIDADCSVRIGSPWLSELAPNESRYYDYEGAETIEAALRPGHATAWPDGGIATTTLDSALGCVTSAPCLARFVDATFAALDGRTGLLNGKTVEEMLARPDPPLWAGSDTYYGLGWRVRESAGGKYIWHSGSMPGTTALVVRVPDGTSVAVLMNSRPRDWESFNEALQKGVAQCFGM